MCGEQAAALRIDAQKIELALGSRVFRSTPPAVSCNACPAAARLDSEDRDREAVNNINAVFMVLFTLVYGNLRVSIFLAFGFIQTDFNAAT